MGRTIRRVRKQFRKEVLMLIAAGRGSLSEIHALAKKIFGNDIGVDVLMRAFCEAETSKALAHLRINDNVESVGGGRWKRDEDLNTEELCEISNRTDKSLHGRLTAAIQFAHEHGLTDEAIKWKKALDAMDLVEAEVEQESESMID